MGTDSAGGGAPPPEYYDQDDADNVCFLCRSPRYTPVFEPSHFGFPIRFMRCQCGIVKQVPMPNERFFEWFFNSDVFFSAERTGNIWGYHDFFADEACRLATSKRRYRKLRRYLEVGRPFEIMKIGPATGTFLHVAKEHGHNVRGCDVSERFAQYARDTYGVEIDIGRFEHMSYDEGQFDALFLFNVIENVPNQDEFLGAIRRAVKPGGLFILNVVDMKHNLVAALQKEKYFLYRPPVTYIYDLPVLERVLSQYGFERQAVFRDVRYLHLEKITTLLGWRAAWAAVRWARIHRIRFPIYAYPSRILVTRRRA